MSGQNKYWILILFLIPAILPAQEKLQGIEYHDYLILKANVSYGHSIVEEYHFFDNYENQKFSLYLGLDYLFNDFLSIGIDAGYQGIYSASREDIKEGIYDDFISAEIFSYPVCLNFGFYFKKLIINAGAGIYLTNSEIQSQGLKSESSFMDFGYSFSAGYRWTIDPEISIVPALRARYLTDSDVLIMSLGFDIFLKLKGFRERE